MFNFFYLFIFIFISKELFYFDEELLVVMSFFIVFTLLYQSLSKIISTELDSRNTLIYNQFLNYLQAKKDLLDLVYLYYQKRNENLTKKFINIVTNTVTYIQNKYIHKFISLISWYQRMIVSKMIALLLLENLYLKKEISNLIFNNNNKSNIEFFIENLLIRN